MVYNNFCGYLYTSGCRGGGGVISEVTRLDEGVKVIAGRDGGFRGK